MSSSKSKAKLKQGHKDDSKKIRYDLLSPVAMDQLVRVLSAGAKKYEDHNWRKGIAMSRLVAASHRHLAAISRGDIIDPEFALTHAAHLMCCAMFMTEQSLRAGMEKFDDLYRVKTNSLAGVRSTKRK